METERFDRLTRALAAAPLRRNVMHAAIGLALGGAAAMQGFSHVEAKKCGPCKKKKKGKCKKTKPNDTPCDGAGKCLNGTCNQPPDCRPAFDIACSGNAACCSNLCGGLFPMTSCGKGGKDLPCLTNVDCVSGVCTGFRCQ